MLLPYLIYGLEYNLIFIITIVISFFLARAAKKGCWIPFAIGAAFMFTSLSGRYKGRFDIPGFNMSQLIAAAAVWILVFVIGALLVSRTLKMANRKRAEAAEAFFAPAEAEPEEPLGTTEAAEEEEPVPAPEYLEAEQIILPSGSAGDEGGNGE